MPSQTNHFVSLVSDGCVLAGDENTVRKMLMHAKLATEKAKWTDPHVKAYALLQAHFSRATLSADLASDQRTVLLKATRLLQVCDIAACICPKRGLTAAHVRTKARTQTHVLTADLPCRPWWMW